ncbi:hypothetical protein Q5752_006104 [Cryptotrichosporon argae]
MVFSPKVYTLLCGCFAALGSILYGYDLGVIASVLASPDFLTTTGDPNETYTGFITSSMLLGAFCGSLPASLIADKFSRRAAITVGAGIFVVGGALQTAAQNRGMMLGGRFVAGFAIGMLMMLAPLYQSEIAHPSIRGRLTTLEQLFLGVGSFIAGWIGYGLTKNNYGSVAQWRIPLGLQITPAIPLLLLTFLLPESPRWLCIVGREEEALHTLARLHARGDVNDAFVQGEFAEMKLKVREEAEAQSSWMQIAKNTENLRKILLGIILQFSVQMTGVSFIQYYSVTIYDAVGYSSATTLLLQSINNVLAILAQLACVIWVDKTGRRLPLIAGNIVSGLCFIPVTVIQKQFLANKGSARQAQGFVAAAWIYNIAFSACIGPLSWAYPVEIMNTAIRAKGTAITSMACWISNFMIGQVSPIAFSSVGWRYFLVFVICCFSNALVIYLLFPETKGRTLEEMDEYFANTHWIVPLSHYKGVAAGERERELARGELPIHPHGSSRVQDVEKGGDKYLEDRTEQV